LVDTKAVSDRHEIDHNLALVGLLGASPAPRTSQLQIQDESHQAAREILGVNNLKNASNLIAIHPWTSNPLKQWPIQNMVELVGRLSEQGLGIPLLIGGPEEQGRVDQFQALLKQPMVSLVGKVDLPTLAALLKQCNLLVSNDSGPVHVASMVGTPTVTLFEGPDAQVRAKRWGPIGSDHTLLVEEGEEQHLSVDSVSSAIRQQLLQSESKAS
jgi:ADP-heptose:LPS heptosyltransferase